MQPAPEAQPPLEAPAALLQQLQLQPGGESSDARAAGTWQARQPCRPSSER